MKKHILIAATAAFLALPNLSPSVLAAPPEASEDAGAHHPQFSPEDFAALTDARIAALKAGLKLTPTQEKNWPALETALREQATARAARIAEWREKAKEPREHRSVIEGLLQGAKRLAARSAELEKLADAAKPLYDSLDDAQKAASGRFYTSPSEDIGITDTKAFGTARISIGMGMPRTASNKRSTHSNC